MKRFGLPSAATALALGLASTTLAPSADAQESRSVFEAATVVLDSSVAPIRRMLDFDLDGDPDGVGLWPNSDNSAYRLYGYRNDGQGGFVTASVATNPTHSNGQSELLIEVGHLNADAWPDVCVVYRSERQDWYGMGNGHFATPTPVTLPMDAFEMVLADLDGDGIDDLSWVDQNSLRVATSLGGSASIPAPGAKYGLRVLVGDGPGGDSLFLVHVLDEVRVFFGNTQGGLSAGPSFEHGLLQALMDTGDIDGDLDVDAVVFGPTAYAVLRRTGPGSWSLEDAAPGGPAEYLRDVDGDGDLDGACCGGGGGGGPTYPQNTQPTEFQIALNDGSGAFAPAFQLQGLGSPQLAGVVDVDGDGDKDLVAGRCVYFASGAIRPPPAPGALPPQHGPRALSDCDGDGDVDVGFSVDSVYTNDGQGRFVQEAPAVPPAPPGSRYRGPGYPGDFDGDGDVDLVVELTRSGRLQDFSGSLPGHDSTISMVLLRNSGQGVMQSPVPASERGVHFAIDSQDPELSLLVDADQDGDLDLLTRSLSWVFSEAETRLWANDGSGHFRAGGREPIFRAIWAGDVDADGDLDLLQCGSGYEGTSTYLYLGSNPVPGRLPTLTWDSRPGYWPLQAHSGLSVADFDQNGYPDFACVTTPPDFGSTQASALNNRFAGGASLVFSNGMSSTVLLDDARISLADLDGSGTVDALSGPLTGELIDISEVLVNRQVGEVQYSSFDRVRQLVPPGQLVDLDGDGAPDLLGARIVFNRHP